MEKLRILVTAIGGDLSQAIVKCLRMAKEPVTILGGDCDKHGIGSAFVDQFYHLPSANEFNYVDALNKICIDNRIDAVIPGSEPEILTLSKAVHFRNKNMNSILVCQDFLWIEKYGDKLSCYNYLSDKIPRRYAH